MCNSRDGLLVLVNVISASTLPAYVCIDSLPLCYAYVANDVASEMLADERNQMIQKSVMNKKGNLGKRKLRTSFKSAKKLKKPLFIGAAKDLPPGWTEEVHRRGGDCTGTSYKYYFSPVMRYKFRAKKSVQIFLDNLVKSNNDEVAAYNMMKESQR